MAEDVLRQHLLRWRMGKLDDTAAESVSAACSQLPRSFRPHRIVPRVYLGALKDVQDTWALHKRLSLEGMLLLVSTCDRNEPPRLELRELLPLSSLATATAPGMCKEDSCRVRRLAVCPWEELEAHVIGSSSETGLSMRVMITARWLQKAISSLRFSEDDENRGKPSDVGVSFGTVHLKLCLPWRDEPLFPVRRHFDLAVTLMQAVVVGLGKAVVCYCVAGASRSVTLMCAFLLRCCSDELHKRNLTCMPVDAVRVVLDFVRSVRLCACPNDGFMQQLTEYAAGIISPQ